MAGKRNSESQAPIKRVKPWDQKLAKPNSSVLLVWCQRRASLLSPLCEELTREIAGYLWEPELLPAVSRKKLYVVNVRTRKSKSIPIPDYVYASFIPVNSRSAVCTYVMEDKLGAFVLDYHTLELTDLHLQAAARDCGILFGCVVTDMLCLFLSLEFEDEALDTLANNTLRKYSFLQRKWTSPLPKPLRGFIWLLVPHKNLAYLLLGNDRVSIFKTFNAQTDELSSEFVIDTPPDIFPLFPWAKLADNRLLCLRNGLNLWTWDYKTGGTYELPSPLDTASYFTQGITIRRGKNLYWAEIQTGEEPLTVYHYKIHARTHVKLTLVSN